MNWVYESEQNDELCYGYAINDELARVQSPYQRILVVDSKAYGKMLLIDNVVMITESDEFVYREMLSHVPVCNHRAPRKLLVVGGGDGGIVRELCKYREVQQIILCEIDQQVIDVCRQHFPNLTNSLDDPRVEIIIADGNSYLAHQVAPASLDIIIVDSTDPVGPGERLFSANFYASISRALKPHGIVAIQSESPWAESSMLQGIYRNLAASFSDIYPYLAVVPTYPRGLWSWTLAGQQPIVPSGFNRQRFNDVASGLQYLTEELMVSSFHLPKFYQHKLPR